MTHHYGFFIPAIDHVIDIEGLLIYLGEKVAIGCTCIYCDRPFTTLEAVRQHMVPRNGAFFFLFICL